MGLDGPARFAVDGATLYWTQSGSGELMRQVASGVSEVIASGRFHPRDIAVDAGTVYWLEEANDGGVASIFSLVPDGGVVQQVSGPSEPASNLVLSSQGLYWVREGRATFLERTWRDFAHVVPFTYGQHGPWHVTSAVDGRNASLFWTDSAAHAIRTAGACDLVAGELNPDWVAIGINPNRTNVLEPGLHVFWVEGARIRRLVTTNIHPWGEWCH
jgi:hypothetical protein